MKYLLRIFTLTCCFAGVQAYGQDSTGLAGTPYQETQPAAGEKSPYLLKEWYSGAVRTSDDRVHDGIPLRYDFVKDEVEYKAGSGLYRVSSGVSEFSIPSGVELYTFRSGYPAVGELTEKSFYRVLYDGNTKLLKKYTSPIKVEKASATREMDAGAKLFLLKDDKMNPVQLGNRNSFMKLLTDERNKLNYVIKEQQLDFAGEDDLIRLLEEYDSYKAGRGGN
ncbi:hypothetical protein GCM10010967_52720 [Dyadobacter beijingensis]|uniref:Uncharacterized protein n=1 Tax=Dyadobacter beijingensis TaxID=365489 RepID=A0ABQ2IGA4_9BACT|nr:hypothetical protein [Dyadobacter beijingensis]GGN10311.1 hypothetical protein GCM10010967_52720 [Dyadobacter beijingensis]